jgi:hypothetical protein
MSVLNNIAPEGSHMIEIGKRVREETHVTRALRDSPWLSKKPLVRIIRPTRLNLRDSAKPQMMSRHLGTLQA